MTTIPHSKTILLAGGTGFIGSRLAEMLREQGHVVRLLTRSPRGAGQFFWNPMAGGIDDAALQDVDAVVNLAGAGIADKRWTKARKREIIETRVRGAAVLRSAFERSAYLPHAYLSASALGYYGNSGERMMTESDHPVDRGFMVECCQRWEQAADTMAALGIRTVKFRIGIVLAQEGGALAELLRPLRFGLGAYFADGRAWWSWIHRDDLCRAFMRAIENQEIEGVFNAVAPQPARNRELIKAVAKAMRQPAVFLPAPAFALRLFFGEMASTILNSNRLSAEKIEAAGFRFQYPALAGALEHIFQKSGQA